MNRFKAIIIDDEPLVRIALREYALTAAPAIEFVGEARDGIEGISLLNERGDIDLVLADIRMPGMSGLEMLTALSDISLPKMPLFVMLSAYSDYEYVRQAFLLGAYDYMLKANLDSDYLKQVMDKATSELILRQSSSSQKEDESSDDDHTLSSILHQLFTDEEYPSSTEVASFSRVSKLMGETNLAVAIIRIANVESPDHEHRMILRTIRTVTQTDVKEGNCCTYRHDSRHYLLFFSFPRQVGVLSVRHRIQSILTDVRMRLRQYMNLPVSIGVSDVMNGLRNGGRLFRQAKKLSNRCFFDGYDRIFYPEAEISSGPWARMSEEIWQEEWAACKSGLIQGLQQRDSYVWQLALDVCCGRLLLRFSHSTDQIKEVLGDLVWDAGILLYREGLSWNYSDHGRVHPVEYISQQESWAATLSWLDRIFHDLHTQLNSSQDIGQRLSPPISKAKAHLDSHFHEDIHLSSVSQMIGVSDSYLSRLFTKEIGSNFIQYLTHLRIEKAKKELKAGQRISDVADQVGYPNPEHFSRVFKKATGVSPKMYRNHK